MTVPHITIEQATIIFPFVEPNLTSANELIDKHNKATEQPLISAEEARKLGAGKAEWLDVDGVWIVCGGDCPYRENMTNSAYIDSYKIKYRAIKQPELIPLDWKGVPMGIAVRNRIVKTAYMFLSIDENGTVCGLFNGKTTYSPYFDLELAPASEQPWLVYIQGETDLSSLKGVDIELRIFNKAFDDFVTLGFNAARYDELKHRIVHYRITGLSKGYGYPEKKGGLK